MVNLGGLLVSVLSGQWFQSRRGAPELGNVMVCMKNTLSWAEAVVQPSWPCIEYLDVFGYFRRPVHIYNQNSFLLSTETEMIVPVEYHRLTPLGVLPSTLGVCRDFLQITRSGFAYPGVQWITCKNLSWGLVSRVSGLTNRRKRLTLKKPREMASWPKSKPRHPTQFLAESIRTTSPPFGNDVGTNDAPPLEALDSIHKFNICI